MKTRKSWRPAQLGNLLLDAKYGLSVRGSSTGEFPILRMNCQQRGRVIFQNIQYVDVDKNTFDNFRLEDDDLLFNRTNSYELVGRTALFRGSRPAVFASYLIRLRVDRSKVDPIFLNFLLNWSSTQNELKGLASRGVSQSNISASKLKDLTVLLPPLEEQRVIGALLWKIQDLIEVQRAVTLTRKEMKAAIMEKVFREGLRGEPVRLKEIGEIPEKWSVISIDEATTLINYGSSTRCSEEANGRAVLRIPNVIGSIDETDIKYATFSDSELARYSLASGDLLFVRTNGNRANTGRCAVYEGKPEGALFASYLIRVRLDKNILLPHFVRAFFSSVGREQLTGNANAAADGKFNINTGTIKRALVPRPSLAEQAEIMRVFECVDRSIHAAQKKLRGLEELFDAALEILMSGQVEVCSEKAGRGVAVSAE